MTAATFFALMIVICGAMAGLLFFISTFRPHAFWSWRVLCLLISSVCFYCATLWGGAQLDIWVLTPELGRPALALTLAALAWLGLLPRGPGMRRGH
jgi:hypothetical protein